MEKINFKNKGETGAIPANANNLNLMQNNVENAINENKASVITVGLESNVEFSNGNLVIPLNKIMASSGSKFELISGKIKIGAGVSKVKISGSILEQTDIPSLYGAYICKNGSNLADAVNVGFSYIPTANEMFKVSLSAVVVEVEPGDLISLTAYKPNGSSSTVTIQAYSGRATNLTIEEVIE